MSSPLANETWFVDRAIQGDAEAFGSLYQAYLDAIFRYVFFRLGDREDAEDLTEQVFLKAWEALPGYKSTGFPFTSWLYRIAHNVVVDYHRRKKPVTSLDQVKPEELTSGDHNSLTAVIASEETRTLIQAIARLTDEQQQVIVLRFVEGMSHNKIARIIGKNEGACRMIQHRALSNLNEILQCLQG